MQALTFLIRLIDPLLATQPQSGEPNSAVTYPFIPGSMIRGALIARYLGGREVDAADDEFRKLFLDGDVRYLNAYPAHPNPTIRSRMLPKPLSWYVPKDDAEKSSAAIYDFAVELLESDEPHKHPNSGDFCHRTEEGAVQLGRPAIRVTVHNASDDRNSKREGDSQVFRYDALAPRETFRGVILSEDKNALENTIQPLLKEGDLILGGSQTAGYGRVEIDTETIDVDLDWQEYTLAEAGQAGFGIEALDSDDEWVFSPSEPERDSVTLICLSDVILPETGEQPEEWLKALVGEEPRDSFRQVRLVGGFNHKWGLPLPQRWALQMGSVFVFPLSCKSKLEELAADGIGERKVEGFGRLAVDWYAQATLKQSALPRGELDVSVPKKLAPDSEALAQRMANRRLQAELDRWLVKRINELTKGPNAFRSLPSPTQLSRARLAARQAWIKSDLGEITNHFRNLTELTQREWKDAKLKDEPLQKWIHQQIEDCTSFSSGIEMPTVATVKAQFDQPLRNRTLARLIEGVLRRAVKEAKGRAEGGDHE